MLDNWRTIARKLEGHYHVILVDLRNHGRSPHDAEMNYPLMAEDVLELINDLHQERINIIGHSMGGKVAMQLALNYQEKIDRLIVVDVVPKKYPPGHRKEIEAVENVDPTQMKNRKEAEIALGKYLGNDQVTIQFLLKNLSRTQSGGFEWKANMPVLIKNYDQVIQAVDSSTPFENPVLFLRGSLSKSVDDEDWPAILKLFPNAKLVTIENAGHWVHADQPEALISQVIAFMES
jgi:pimeloyl-ACP methyl ester carboxylesterase